MIRQCSNCKHAYSQCHDEMKKQDETSMRYIPCCAYWESDEDNKNKKEENKGKKGRWF
jgi:hypothetical protein